MTKTKKEKGRSVVERLRGSRAMETSESLVGLCGAAEGVAGREEGK